MSKSRWQPKPDRVQAGQQVAGCWREWISLMGSRGGLCSFDSTYSNPIFYDRHSNPAHTSRQAGFIRVVIANSCLVSTGVPVNLSLVIYDASLDELLEK